MSLQIKTAGELKALENRLNNTPFLLQNFTFEKSEDQEDLPAVLIGDERRLKQVLINLIKNAKKFTNKGKIEIMVGYDYELEYLHIHVKDSGKGIAQEDMQRLFTRFGKLQRTAESNSEGIGLGLEIVRTII